MIISKTPLRISFVGGGSDIIDNHNKEGSVINAYVLSTSDSSFIESNVKDSEHIPAEEFNNLFSIL